MPWPRDEPAPGEGSPRLRPDPRDRCDPPPGHLGRLQRAARPSGRPQRYRLHPRVVRLFQRPFEENVDTLLPLLPFEILRNYTRIRTSQEIPATEQCVEDLGKVRSAFTTRREYKKPSLEDMVFPITHVLPLAREAYADNVPFLQSSANASIA